MVTRMECADCDSVVEGNFPPCSVCALDEETRHLFDLFMKARGNLKDVQKDLGVSYPTVRNRIETMFEAYEEKAKVSQFKRMDVLKMLRDGKLSIEEAEDLLKGAL